MEDINPYLEIINTVAIIILGIAFYAQNKIVESMKNFMEIFDTKKVRDFADMREETVMTNVNNLISNDEKIKELMHDIVGNKVNDIAEFYKDAMGKEYTELFNSTAFLIKKCLSTQEDEQVRFVEEFLPSVKHKIMPVLFPESDENKTS